MSKDMMIFNACNHKIDRVEYPALECPLCKGKGFYYDIAYDQRGRIVTCDNEIKLQQEILKILNDIKGGNLFHPNYGNNIYNIGFLFSFIISITSLSYINAFISKFNIKLLKSILADQVEVILSSIIITLECINPFVYK